MLFLTGGDVSRGGSDYRSRWKEAAANVLVGCYVGESRGTGLVLQSSGERK